MTKPVIAILGAGSWGSAIAIHLAKHGNPVLLWTHRTEHREALRHDHLNRQYLPGIPFPPSLEAGLDLNACLKAASILIIAVPSYAFHTVLNNLPVAFKPKGIAWLTKGLDPKENTFLSELVVKKWGTDFPMAIISGPSFAREVAMGLPTALTIASNNFSYQTTLQHLFHHDYLRVYLSNDLIGVQWCGAVKNILAIACGISDGLGFGANAKAALITRGLVEMSRLGKQLGAKDNTFRGLAGLGDLVLTCTDNQSRNRRFGLALAQGSSIVEATNKIGQVVEGKDNVKQVCEISERLKTEMPICMQINAILKGSISPQEAAHNLIRRFPGIE